MNEPGVSVQVASELQGLNVTHSLISEMMTNDVYERKTIAVGKENFVIRLDVLYSCVDSKMGQPVYL